MLVSRRTHKRNETYPTFVWLSQENAKLREQNEDLHVQLLNNRLEEGRTLLQNGAEASLAAELETLPRDEVSDDALLCFPHTCHLYRAVLLRNYRNGKLLPSEGFNAVAVQFMAWIVNGPYKQGSESYLKYKPDL